MHLPFILKFKKFQNNNIKLFKRNKMLGQVPTSNNNPFDIVGIYF